MQRVGVIGLGVMGRPMALNLLRSGYEVWVHDRRPQTREALVAQGARPAGSPGEIARAVECIITMLPDSPHVREVLTGPGGVADSGTEGLVVVDMSTISPIVSREIGEVLAGRGMPMLDAPVSGGEPGAVAGTLSIMVGGDPDTFAAVRPILEVLGSSVSHHGPLGAGGFTKLANQVVTGAISLGIAEALLLARRAGLDHAATVEALSAGTAGSRFLEIKRSKYLERTYQPGFAAELHSKDLRLALEAARALDVPMPLTGLTSQMFAAMRACGLGQVDNAGTVLLLEHLAGEQPEDGSG